MKKFLAMLLAAVMVLSLVACGGNDNAGNTGDSGDASGDTAALGDGLALCAGRGVAVSAEGEGVGVAPGLTLQEQAVSAAAARASTNVKMSFLFKGFASFAPYCAPLRPAAYAKKAAGRVRPVLRRCKSPRPHV